jgi:TRAP-type C4-dicarboxylate transport system substrate-binding protein
MTRLTALRRCLAAGCRGFAAPALALIHGLAEGLALPAFAQDKKVDLRLSPWVPPAHPLTAAAKVWAEDIATPSNGTIKITIFPSEQLGKAFDHYDMARGDIADITYLNPGYEPGRFPNIAIGQMPFTFGDDRTGTAALDSWYRANTRRRK